MYMVPITGMPNFPEILDMNKETIPRVHEKQLGDRVKFLYYPNRAELNRYHGMAISLPRPPGAPAEPVFVGQVPHLLPVEIIGWVVDTILGKYSCQWMTRGRKQGCMKVWVANRDDLEKLITFTRCLFFDLNGVWFVNSETDPLGSEVTKANERDIMDDYTDGVKQGAYKIDPRLPKGGIVFEFVGLPNKKSANENPSSLQQIMDKGPPGHYRAFNP